MSLYTGKPDVTVDTGTNTCISYFENGERVYPCRCGETHRGDYACEDWNHHNCFHDTPLLLIADDQAVCGECGKSWFAMVIDDGRA